MALNGSAWLGPRPDGVEHGASYPLLSSRVRASCAILRRKECRHRTPIASGVRCHPLPLQTPVLRLGAVCVGMLFRSFLDVSVTQESSRSARALTH